MTTKNQKVLLLMAINALQHSGSRTDSFELAAIARQLVYNPNSLRYQDTLIRLGILSSDEATEEPIERDKL